MSLPNVPGLFVPSRTADGFETPQQNAVSLDGTKYQDSLYGSPVTFSYADCQAFAILPFHAPGKNLPLKLLLPGLQLVSLSTHRDHYPVMNLGHTGVQGYTSGHRTSAGTLGFSVLGEDPFAQVLAVYSAWRGYNQPMDWVGIDEVPEFDISLIFTSDRGDTAITLIKGAKFSDVGRNISIRDIQLTHVYAFMAVRITNLIRSQQAGRVPSNPPIRQPLRGPGDTVFGPEYSTPYSFSTTSISTSTNSTASTSTASSSTSTASSSTASTTASSSTTSASTTSGSTTSNSTTSGSTTSGSTMSASSASTPA